MFLQGRVREFCCQITDPFCTDVCGGRKGLTLATQKEEEHFVSHDT